MSLRRWRFRFRSWRGWMGMAALAPLAVSTSGVPQDSSATRFGFAAGAGDFAVVARGCDHEVISKYQRTFRDAGASVSHEFRGPLVVGLRSQRISGEGVQGGNTDWSLWNPNVSMEWRRFGIGGGWVTSSSNRKLADVDLVPASGHLRIGDPGHLSFSFRLMEGEPYFSSGGAFEARLSGQVGSRIRPWMGLGGAEPFDDVGFLVGAEARVAPGWNLDVGGRLGQSEGLNENAIRAGLSYTWTHRRYFAPVNPLPDSILPSR